MQNLEMINEIGMIVCGLLAGLSLHSKRMAEFPRWLTFPISLTSCGLILHGIHHFMEDDVWVGAVSDFAIWFGFGWMHLSSVRIYMKKMKDLRAQD